MRARRAVARARARLLQECTEEELRLAGAALGLPADFQHRAPAQFREELSRQRMAAGLSATPAIHRVCVRQPPADPLQLESDVEGV